MARLAGTANVRSASIAIVVALSVACAFVGRQQEASANVEIGGDWWVSMAIHTPAIDYYTSCLVRITEEDKLLNVAIACTDSGGGGRMTGSIGQQGRLLLEGTQGAVDRLSLDGEISADGASMTGTWRYGDITEGPFGGTRETPTTWGDADCNGDVNALDVLQVLSYHARLPTGRCPEFADVNVDGAVNSSDALLLLQYLSGLIGQLPVPQ